MSAGRYLARDWTLSAVSPSLGVSFAQAREGVERWKRLGCSIEIVSDAFKQFSDIVFVSRCAALRFRVAALRFEYGAFRFFRGEWYQAVYELHQATR